MLLMSFKINNSITSLRPEVVCRLRSHLPRKLEDGAHSSSMITFQRSGSQVLKETFLSCKTGKRLILAFKKIYIPKWKIFKDRKEGNKKITNKRKDYFRQSPLPFREAWGCQS